MAKEELLKLKYFTMERPFAPKANYYYYLIIKIKIQDNFLKKLFF
jgi:hypothetical protein